MDDERAARIIEAIKPFRIRPGREVVVERDFDPGYTAEYLQKEQSEGLLREGVVLLSEFQARLAAQNTYGLLVIIQALDAAGKDGTISHVMSGVNPQGVNVVGFKSPSTEELDHDYMWRCAKCLPARGDITIFNRSYYEEVLVVRVHPEFLAGERIPESGKTGDIWKQRYREINNWERYLVDNGFRIVKLFLNVSKEEQRRRFLDRLDEPDKNWKFSVADAAERTHWDEYQRAFSEMLSNTSTRWAPWYVIPADHKWFARLAAAGVIIDALAKIDPRFPVVSDEAKQGLLQARAALEAEAPNEGAKNGSGRASQGDEAGAAAGNAGRAAGGGGNPIGGDSAEPKEVAEAAADFSVAVEVGEPPARKVAQKPDIAPVVVEPTEVGDPPSVKTPKGMRGRVIGFGEIELDGKRYRSDLVIEGGKVRKRNKGPSKALRGADGHTPLSLAENIPWGGERLVVGTGIDGALPVMAEVFEEADRRGIELMAVPLEQALVLLAGVRKKEAFAVLHVTC
jgi:PPK2 family polyphosphate:nucleotide phosphotransferase